MKKFLKWTGITLLALVLLIIAAPFLFKKQIVQMVKDTVNNELNAKVDFGEFDLTLISSFPDFSLSIDSLSVANVGDFEGDTLLSAANITLGLDLMSVINGSEYKINKISLDKPRIQAFVLKNGKANWDITKPSADTSTTVDTTASTPFKMTLKKLEIKNAYILYDDASLDCKTELYNMTHTLKGDFTEDNFIMETLTEIEKFSLSYGGVKYMNNVNTKVKADIAADMPNFKFTFKENEFNLNALTLGLDGYFAMPKDDMDMDLKFKAHQTEFKNILSLIPGAYTADFADVKTKGLLSLDGFVKGIYNDTKMPAFNLKLLVKDAMFQYPSLPKAANNIQVDLLVDNKTGNPDATVIDLRRFHVEMAGNPVDAKLHVSTPVSDANIIGEVIAKLNLESLKDVIPLEKGDKLNGLIDANVKMAGRMSSIEKEEYDKFDASGSVIIKDMNYSSKSLGYPTQIKNMKLDFTPKYVVLETFDALVGKSDIKLNGRIDNFLEYALKDSLLSGSFNLTSSVLDLNELMAEDSTATQPAASTPDTAAAAMSLVEVPSNLDVILTTSIGKLIYDNLNITDVSGAVKIKDSKMSMEKLKLNMNDLEGSVLMNGVYSTQNIKKPTADLDLVITNFDIAKTFKMFNTVQKLAPIAKYTKGKFGTTLKFSTVLNQHMEPDLNTLAGYGKLVTKSVIIEGFEPVNKLADALKQEKFKKLTLQDLNISYEFKDGRVAVKETPLKIGNSTAKVKGSTGFDQTIDYTWNLEIPRSELGSQANATAGSLVDQLNKQAGTSVKLSDKVKVDVLFGGTVTKPTVKTTLPGLDKASVKEQAKEQIKEAVTQVIDDAKEKARAEADKILKDAQAQADKIKAEAQALADKTRQEGYAAVDKTISDAKNPIAKKAAEIAAPAAKKEVDKKVQKILDEANQKADGVLQNAKIEANKKLQ